MTSPLLELFVEGASFLGAILLPVGFIALCYLAVWHLFIKDLKAIKELRKPEAEKRQRIERDKAEVLEIKRQHSARPTLVRKKSAKLHVPREGQLLGEQSSLQAQRRA